MPEATQQNHVPICAVVYVEDRGLEVVGVGDVAYDLDTLLKAHMIPAFSDVTETCLITNTNMFPWKLSVLDYAHSLPTTGRFPREYVGRPHILVYSNKFQTVEHLMEHLREELAQSGHLDQEVKRGEWTSLKLLLFTKGYKVNDGFAIY